MIETTAVSVLALMALMRGTTVFAVAIFNDRLKEKASPKRGA
jgi:hypothetical protein